MFWSGIMNPLLANVISNGLMASSRFYLDELMRAWVWDIFEECRSTVEEKVKCFQTDHLHAGHCFITFIEENQCLNKMNWDTKTQMNSTTINWIFLVCMHKAIECTILGLRDLLHGLLLIVADLVLMVKEGRLLLILFREKGRWCFVWKDKKSKWSFACFKRRIKPHC